MYKNSHTHSLTHPYDEHMKQPIVGMFLQLFVRDERAIKSFTRIWAKNETIYHA